MSALGLRRPRSIWLRYGFDTPAACASWRSEILACSRCSRMYSPIEFTVTLRMPPVWHAMLANANNLQAAVAAGSAAAPPGPPGTAGMAGNAGAAPPEGRVAPAIPSGGAWCATDPHPGHPLLG